MNMKEGDDEKNVNDGEEEKNMNEGDKGKYVDECVEMKKTKVDEGDESG